MKVRYVKDFTPARPNNTTLQKIISGGQAGVDIAALRAAKRVGFLTGGFMPRGFVTIEGNKPKYKFQYGLEDNCYNYKERTWRNVYYSDATIRIASDFHSKDEICTLNAIRAWKKPHLDIFWEPKGETFPEPEEIAVWITKTEIRTLNVAGNTNVNLEERVESYLTEVFLTLIWA